MNWPHKRQHIPQSDDESSHHAFNTGSYGHDDYDFPFGIF